VTVERAAYGRFERGLVRVRLALLIFLVLFCAAPPAQAMKQPLGPEFPISNPSTGIAGPVSVAADSDTGRYLVVWGREALRGRVIDRDGTPLTDELVLSDIGWGTRGLDVAYNAATHEYLVFFSGTVSVPWPSGAVLAQRVSASGAKIGGVITVGPADPNFMSVACSSRSGTCLVAWSGFGVHARLLGPEGNPVTPQIELAPSGGQIRRAGQTGPAVAYAPPVDLYLVVWGDEGSVTGAMFGGVGGVPVGPCCGIVSRGYAPLVAYNSAWRQFGVLYTGSYQLATAAVLENGDHSPAGNLAPGTSYRASFAFDSRDHLYLAAWPGANGGGGGSGFISADLTKVTPADFAVGYYVTYNTAADEYLLIRPSCDQPGGLKAVCGRRVGNPVAADRTGPRLLLTVRRLQRIVRQRGLVLRARCDEACTVRASARIKLPGARRSVALRRVTRSLAANARTRLKLKTSKRALRKLRRALRRKDRLGARLTVTAADPSGNRTVAKRKLRARR
jgi:hypothetical protein